MSMSAKMFGEVLGKTAREVNLLLKERGLLDGKPGNWNLTELGKQFCEVRKKYNGYGGYAARKWDFPMWEEKIVDKLQNK
ncbi:hypothetical protein ABE021_13520 [Sporosarcina gallistercoris]|uniref:hypothetical protein n=1 Tax=Sporosarcina gallistercoris TaxID=2762245 RepID=UPI003D294B4E